ncbi:type III pantothenate kinase [Haloferula helveola]|uniref:Type III pantothenate kinase n=1 Tax=Haloferula helveola TaxID=490095 RepID=A0ABM7RHX7_9BACT|nr:type III pantothenate kinase [Haloferula helveola]
MKLLLVDNSNTRTKFALSDPDGSITATFWTPTSSIEPDVLAQKLSHLDFDAAVICSVVPDKRGMIEAYLSVRGPLHRITHESPLNLAIDYPKPPSIGADRLANAVGVVARHGAPAIVIDFGTAVTFDIVSKKPAYVGGVIAPGLGAMSDYLGRKTALLPQIELAEPESAIGKSTAGAMQAGAVIGYRGLVREIIAAIRSELGGQVKTIATGGDAGLIASGVAEIDTVDRDLTLAGIDRIGRRAFG